MEPTYLVEEIRDPQQIAQVLANWLCDHPEVQDDDEQPDSEWYKDQDADWAFEQQHDRG